MDIVVEGQREKIGELCRATPCSGWPCSGRPFAMTSIASGATSTSLWSSRRRRREIEATQVLLHVAA